MRAFNRPKKPEFLIGAHYGYMTEPGDTPRLCFIQKYYRRTTKGHKYSKLMREIAFLQDKDGVFWKYLKYSKKNKKKSK